MTDSTLRITSKANARIKEVCKIKDHPSASLFAIEGKHLCDMAFESGCLLETFALEETSYPGVKNTLVNEEVLSKLAFSPSPSGIVGLAKVPVVKPKRNKALILDRVQDPGNVGTICRSALSFGYDQIYLTKGCASCFGYKAIASSQGAIFRLDLIDNQDGEALIRSLLNEGYDVIASCLHGATPLKEFAHKNPFALILGNEGRGIDEKLLALSSSKVKIEMEGIDSLNVGVAAGILMYCL